MMEQNISRGIVISVLINIFLSNLFLFMLSPEGFRKNYQAAFGRCELVMC